MKFSSIVNFVKARPILCLLILSISIRLVGNFIFDTKTQGLEVNFAAASSGENSMMARGLLKTGAFTFFTPGGHATPSAYQPPLFPTFLAGVFSVFGDGKTAFIAVQIFQSFLGGLIVVMVYWLARRFIGNDYALLAGILASFWPAFAYMPNEAHPISVLVVVLLWMTMLAIDILREGPTLKRCLWLGVAFALCVFTRSEVIPGIFVMSLVLLRQTKSPAILAAMAIAFAAEGAWVYHNYLYLGKPLLTTTIGLNLFRGDGPTATGGSYEKDGTIVWETPETKAATDALPWSRDYEVKRDAIYMTAFKESLKGDELRPIRLLPAKFFYFWTADFTHPKGKSPIVWVPWLALFPFTLMGMRKLLKSPGAWPLFFWCGYYLLIELALFALPRYRMGVEGMFLIFAAVGICYWRNRKRTGEDVPAVA